MEGYGGIPDMESDIEQSWEGALIRSCVSSAHVPLETSPLPLPSIPLLPCTTIDDTWNEQGAIRPKRNFPPLPRLWHPRGMHPRRLRHSDSLLRLRRPAAAARAFVAPLALAPAIFVSPLLSAAEVFEVDEARFSELPGGKEADGIVGDFVLRNDLVEATISGDLPLRRPNMGGFYGDGNETPGVLYDLTLRGEANDQITIFCPSGQRGPVSSVRIAEGLEEGLVGVETLVTPARGDGLERRHLYLLAEGWQGILVVSTIRNAGEAERPFKLDDIWTQMRSRGHFKGIHWADAIDPDDKCGYAYGWVEEQGATLPRSQELTLRPGETVKVARFLAVGRSPAEAVGLVSARRKGESVGEVVLRLLDEEGSPATRARVGLKFGDAAPVPAYPDAEGNARFLWPAGEFEALVDDIGRESVALELALEAGGSAEIAPVLGVAARVAFAIVDEAGGDTPCKVQFHGRRGTEQPDLGPTDRAHGCRDQWHSATGSFEVPLPPGDYRIVVTRGPEFDAITRDISLEPAGRVEYAGTLVRSVETPGWISADFHNHSTPSGDNTCGTPDRLINLAAEHIEFAPTTEHNRLYDWAPTIEALGLVPFLATVPGMELTGRGAHLNAFPLEPDPRLQDGGAPVWQQDPRINAILLRDWQGGDPDRWVHLNHPDMSENFIDRSKDGTPDGGYLLLGSFLDGLETQNYRGSMLLSGTPFSIHPSRTGVGRQVTPHREFIWLQLLNQGLRVWGIGVADAHHVYGNGVGSWRTYLPSASDEPSEIDWREISRHAKEGRIIVTSAPYLEVETAAGTIAGGTEVLASGENTVSLKVRVQCANWYEIDRVQVLVNGAQDPRYNFTKASHPERFHGGVVSFDETLEIALEEDAHLIVVAVGENTTLQRGFGTSDQAAIHPMAYNNPIFVDVDGDGFRPNLDTLGFDLPVGGLTVDDAEALLAR